MHHQQPSNTRMCPRCSNPLETVEVETTGPAMRQTKNAYRCTGNCGYQVDAPKIKVGW